MKKSVMLLALLCLLFVFQSVFAHTNPTAIPDLVYDGTDQYLVKQGVPDSSNQHFYYRNPYTNQWGENLPAGHFPGVYTVEWLLVNGDTVPDPDRPGSKLSVTIKEFNPPQAALGLVYDGSSQVLIKYGTGVALGKDAYYYRNRYTGEWTLDKTEATDAGTYTVEYYLANPENPPKKEETGTKFTAAISAAPVTPEQPTPTACPDDPKPINRVYDGLERELVVAGAPKDGYTWWYKLISFSNPADSTAKAADAGAVIHGIPSDTWTQQIPLGTNPGTYVVRCLLLSNSVTNPDNLQLTDVSDSRDVTVVIGATEGDIPAPQPQPQPGPRPRPDVDPGIPFYYNGDGSDLFSTANTLPATGFPTRIRVPLSVKPENVNYEQLAMRIQIPTINVDTELTGVPAVNGSWMVEWLGDRAGLLSGSAIPGEGYSMIAAHNHLNTEEYGPFALLFSLEENDRIFVNTAEDGLQIYSVYANELLEPDDLQKMAAIAGSEDNSVILVTCENEMIEGGYMNRRAVFAKPLF